MRGGRPQRPGEDDIMPLGPLGPRGTAPPSDGGGRGIGGGPLMPPGMGGPGLGPLGGMHVGPGHPYFSDRMRHPDLGPGGFGGGALPGGARWDPINPEGLEGWSPDDFQPRPGPQRLGLDVRMSKDRSPLHMDDMHMPCARNMARACA
ncbi:MAG: hypothetical protein J3K34DRAFT_433908 [Monoraphidium minutum]|nr:MAG: hypothetical protein J3K34DRAFT_433908 [Monoraphidium minutum]